MSGPSYDHPLGLAPPAEWWTEQKGHASTEQYRAWQASTWSASGRPSKYGADAGYYADLGHYLRSKLEAQTERLIRYLGYCQLSRADPVPETGRWYKYECARIQLPGREGAVIVYKPDFQVWDQDKGEYSIWEAKGAMTQKSKTILRLMEKQHPEIPLKLITAVELRTLADAALWEAKRRGEKTPAIPGWDEGHSPKPKP